METIKKMVKLCILLLIICFIIPQIGFAQSLKERDHRFYWAVEVSSVFKEIRAEYPKWEDKFTPHFFDCSEMSAFVSYKLTKAGFPNHIVIGKANFIENFAHAWIVLDECPELVIEATSLSCPCQLFTSYSDLYTEYSSNAITKQSEWDWWNSITNQQWYLYKLTQTGNAGQKKWAKAQQAKDYRPIY